MKPIKDFQLHVSEWRRPENIDIWYQLLTVQTGSHEQTLGVRLAISGYELSRFGAKHPSELPRHTLLNHVKAMCHTLIDHIEQTIRDEEGNNNGILYKD